ncbi:MAG: ArnT family glycosyltransferase [Phycisphaerae bacterium]
MTIAGAADRSAQHRVLVVLLLICALGLLLRIYHVAAAVAISPDSALFIGYARELAEDPIAALKQHDQHPLYPSLILLFHGLVGWMAGSGSAAWIVAGRLVAIAGSLGAILALYWFTARLYDRPRGLIAAGLLAVLPDACRYGADVLTDLPHLSLYLVGLAALLAGMQTHAARYLLLAAAAAGLAFLTRPEGAAILPVSLAVVALHRDWPLKRRAGLVAAMVTVFFCLVGPYQLATGRLIQKKSPLELFKLDVTARLETPATTPGSPCHAPDREWSSAERAALATTLPVPVNVLRQWVRAGRVVYILLAILGLVVARPGGVGGRILALALGIHLLLLYALETRYGYLDRRHALILVTLALPVAAAGAWWLADRIGRRAATAPDALRRRAVVGIVTVCVLATSPWLLRPINPGEEHVIASARWLAEHTPPGTLIVTDSRLRRVALYADRPYAEWPWWNGGVRDLAAFLGKHAKDTPACRFVVDSRHITLPERNPTFFEQLDDQLGDRLSLLHTEPSPPHAKHATEIRIYRYRAQRASPASR